MGTEANRIERHLEECPFCSDAYEGLKAIDPTLVVKDVQDLKDSIQTRSRTKTNSGWWLRVAAGIAILSISTYLLVRNISSVPEQKTALQDSTEVVTEELEQLSSSNLEVDSLEAESSEPLANIEQPDSESEELMAEESSGAGVAAPEEEIALLDDEFPPDSISIVEELIAKSEVEQTEPTKTEEISEPVEQVITSAPKRSARAARETPVQMSQPQALEADALVASPLIQIEALQGNHDFDKDAAPLDGKDQYSNSLTSSLKYPDEASRNNIRGFVTVRFTVDSVGALSEFEVVSSLGYGCDEEAIRVIRDGPNWLPATLNDKKVSQTIQVRIPFPASNQ